MARNGIVHNAQVLGRASGVACEALLGRDWQLTGGMHVCGAHDGHTVRADGYQTL
jgi:hypothetical protein